MKFSIGWPRIHRAFTSSQRRHLDHAVCRLLRSFLARPDPISARWASSLGFVAQPSNPYGFVVNRRKPRGLGAAPTPIPLMTWLPRRLDSMLVFWSKPTKPRVLTLVVSRYPALAPPWFWGSTKKTVPDFVLLFLPPWEPHLIPFGHRLHRAELTCLSTPQRPHRLRPFAPTLHLHQRKSSRTCTYNTRSRVSPHHVVNHSSHHGATIHWSSDAPVLNCPLILIL
jgi:hypothetical protein